VAETWLYQGRVGVVSEPRLAPVRGRLLYTPEERARRDTSVWTLVQGVLAPLQFLVFLVSTGLVVRFLLTGEGEMAATVSVVVKTLILYTIMVTGSIWEKVVFGKWLFAEPFFWEDMVSMLVLALHTLYLLMLLAGSGTAEQQMLVALIAYASYVVNATQFLLKLRAARLEGARSEGARSEGAASGEGLPA
jgi:3-vinyl bacteriochlorophyllide hydratase